MLTPTELLEVVDTMQPIVDELNHWITRDIIRRMMARLDRGEEFTLTGTDEWQIEVYKAAGGHYEALQQEIKRFTKKSDKEVKEIFEDIGIRAWESDMDFYADYGFESVSLFQSESMLKLLEETYRRTNGEIHNFTRTTAETSQQRLIKALDSAHFKVMSGAQSYTQAVKDAVNEIADTQATVRYPSGHIDTIETAVLRAVRTGAGQASGNMTMQGLIDRDWDLIRVSAHLGARYGDGGQNPSNHFWWQGKIYSRTGRTEEYPLFEESTGYGTGEGLCGYNCRHSFGPGDPNHNPYQDFDAEENKKAYDLSQKQRRAESRIRKSKSKLIALREAMDCSDNEEVKAAIQEEYNKEAAKLTKYNVQYDKFCEDNNLKKLSDRISVAKWNRSEAAKARSAVNKTKSVDNSAESGIINKYKGNGQAVASNGIFSRDTIKKVEKATKKVTKDFPILKQYSEPITFGTVDGGGHAVTNYSSQTGLSKIILNKDSFSNVEELIKQLDNDYINGISYKVKGIESLIAHETGHSAHIALALKRAGLVYGVPLKGENLIRFNEEYLKIQQEVYIASFNDESLEEIYKACSKELGSMTFGNAVELIAQSFGNYYFGVKRSEISTCIVDYFKKELK